MFREREHKEKLERVESQLRDNQETLQKQINDLKKDCQTYSRSLKSIEKKLQYLCTVADGEFADVRQSLDRTDQSLSQKIDLLEVNVQRQNRLLKLGFKKIRHSLNEEHKKREYLLIEELYQYYNGILETKISKDEVSDILLEMCYQIADRKTLELNGEIATEIPQ